MPTSNPKSANDYYQPPSIVGGFAAKHIDTLSDGLSAAEAIELISALQRIGGLAIAKLSDEATTLEEFDGRASRIVDDLGAAAATFVERVYSTDNTLSNEQFDAITEQGDKLATDFFNENYGKQSTE